MENGQNTEICNFGYVVEKNRSLYPDHVAIEDLTKQKTFTWEDLDIRANKVSSGLKKIGVKKGDRVCAILLNTIEYCDIFLGCQKIGAIFSPLNFRLSLKEITYILKHARPKILVFDNVFSALVDIPHQKTIKFISVGKSDRDDNTLSYDELLGQGNGEVADEYYGKDTLAVMMYTAGTTGHPKAVALTNENLLFAAIDANIQARTDVQDVILVAPPLFHIGAFSWLFTPALYMANRLIFPGFFDPTETYKIIENKQVTMTLLIVTMIKMLYNIKDKDSYDISSLKLMGAGGEPCPEFLKEYFKGCIAPGYGLTESCGTGALLPTKNALSKPANCIGKLSPSYDMRLLNNTTGEVQNTGEGELLLRGPSIAKGYWNMSEETTERFQNGWFHTGDICKKDEDGFLYWLGRSDEMIKSGGENIFPSEIEQVIQTHPMVESVCVIGVVDEKWGTVPKAVIVVRKGGEITKDGMLNYIKGKIADFKRPRQYEFVEELPVKPTAKMPIDREKVKELYGNQ